MWSIILLINIHIYINHKATLRSVQTRIRRTKMCFELSGWFNRENTLGQRSGDCCRRRWPFSTHPKERSPLSVHTHSVARIRERTHRTNKKSRTRTVSPRLKYVLPLFVRKRRWNPNFPLSKQHTHTLTFHSKKSPPQHKMHPHLTNFHDVRRKSPFEFAVQSLGRRFFSAVLVEWVVCLLHEEHTHTNTYTWSAIRNLGKGKSSGR